MVSRSASRVEIVLVVAIVLVTALYVRYLFIPPFPDLQVQASEQKYGFDVGDPGPWFSAWSVGDGQAYAMIAIDPTGQKLDEAIEETTYRFSRAGFGWAAAAFSLGQDHLVPYGLAVASVLSLVGLIAVTIKLRQQLGRRAWLIVLNPALFIAVGGDTSESLAILLLAIAIGWGSWAAALALGVTSPTFLVAVWGRWRLVVAGVSSAAALATCSFFAFGSESFMPHGGRLGLPLVAYFEHPSIWGASLAVVAMVTIGVGLRARDWAWVVAGLFVLCFGWDVLREPSNAWRAAGFIPVLWAFGPGWVPGRDVDRTLQLNPTSADVA